MLLGAPLHPPSSRTIAAAPSVLRMMLLVMLLMLSGACLLTTSQHRMLLGLAAQSQLAPDPAQSQRASSQRDRARHVSAARLLRSCVPPSATLTV
jgi:hypothetical protein